MAREVLHVLQRDALGEQAGDGRHAEGVRRRSFGEAAHGHHPPICGSSLPRRFATRVA